MAVNNSPPPMRLSQATLDMVPIAGNASARCTTQCNSAATSTTRQKSHSRG